METVRTHEVTGETSETSADRPVVISTGLQPLTGRALRADVLGLRRCVPRGGTAALVGSSARLVAAALVALEGWAVRVELVGDLDPSLVSANAVVLRDTGTEITMDVPRLDAEHCARCEEGTPRTAWRLFSSGTTGAPKPTDHSFASLTRLTRRAKPRAEDGDRAFRRWGLLFPPMRMAGIQVVLQAVHGGDTLVDAHGVANLDERLRCFAQSGVDALSATPTMWRMILSSQARGALRLRQITLGGEIADQPLLDALSRHFSARLTHVYASTEAGAAFSVSDGLEGFPRHFLDAGPGGAVLRVHDDALLVQAPGSSMARSDGFVDTGDLVEIRGDRVHFVGRASGQVNVGGDKVSPEQVEEVLRRHPAVADALVVPRRSRITGWILTSEVVPSRSGADLDRGELQSALRDFVAHHLPRSHVPARVTVVSRLSLSSTGKASRA